MQKASDRIEAHNDNFLNVCRTSPYIMRRFPMVILCMTQFVSILSKLLCGQPANLSHSVHSF